MIWDILIPVAVGAVMLVIGTLIGYNARKKTAESKISSAEEYAKKIVEEAVAAGEARRKEMLVEAKEEILRAKTEAERENKERRQEVIRLENRALAKEETLDKKLENYERREEQLNQKIKDNDIIKKELEQKKAEVNELAKRIYKLEKINIELTKHGLLLTGKTIEAMLKGVAAVNNEYNAKGQNITDDRLKMSSIVEEA